MMSHRLLLKAGFIHQLGAGIFSFTPIGWRVISKIKDIIHSEMRILECHEANFPVVQPADIWIESGRMENFIPPLARFKDRRDKVMVIAPTHEESVLAMVRRDVKSYRDLPFSIYHIQTKFRDETRPRGGLLRVREFEMKDAYSFHSNQQSLDQTYEEFSQAYFNIFNRCGLDVIKVEADSGAIGGKVSAEFISVASNGEDTVLKCEQCSYAANEEKAEFVKTIKSKEDGSVNISEVETKNIKSINQLAKFFDKEHDHFLKTVVYMTDENPILVTLTGELEVNETKLKNFLGREIRLAEDREILDLGLIPGFLSPLNQKIEVLVDNSVNLEANYIVGSNREDFHSLNVIPQRDFQVSYQSDVAKAKSGHLSVQCDVSRCKGMVETKGIEVGHIFKLGSAYSSKMGLNFLDSGGKEKSVEMGCYGIGVGRLLAAAVEANSTEMELILDKDIAPFEIYLANINSKDENVTKSCEKIYSALLDSGFEVLFDDRDESPGVKFKDYDLIGVPVRIVVSQRSLENLEVELKVRGNDELKMIPVSEVTEKLRDILDK